MQSVESVQPCFVHFLYFVYFVRLLTVSHQNEHINPTPHI